MAFPFLLRSQHGLVVRSAHDNSIHVGDLRIQRIIFIERVVPHGRPEIIRLEPQQQFEYFLVELMVEVPELLMRPSAEGWRLVI